MKFKIHFQPTENSKWCINKTYFKMTEVLLFSWVRNVKDDF